MKTHSNLFVVSSLTLIPLSTAFTAPPPAVTNHQARTSTQLYNSDMDYERMPMDKLQMIANEKGYDT